MSALVLTSSEACITSLRINRPELRNAFNDELISELTNTFKNLEKDKNCRAVIISGEGESFCAGADLNWMKSMMGASKQKNEADAQRLAKMLAAINAFPKPVMAQVQGAAIGGGVGLVAVCDIVIAAENTIFALAEVKLGLIPAVISPYVISKMGVSAARRYFLTGERFKTEAALRYGLIHEVVAADQLSARVQQISQEFVSSGPEAVKAAKILALRVGSAVADQKIQNYTLKKIAALRVSPEGQEGMRAFLEKRKPNWNVS